jgi:predicted TIM-barrel fold metal-dependent hydrolase
LLKAYGPERMIYGGGYGTDATGDSYRATREYVRELLLGLNPSDQARVLGGNAAKLMGFA